jgi:methionyl-tRNA synthetase
MRHKRILVTSALPYANGPLHLGHIAGAYLPADIHVRYQRLKGRDVVFIGGSDEHGVPITVTADNEGITPQAVVDRYHEMNRKSFERLGISYDNYSRTSLPVHHRMAQEFFTILHQKGDLTVKTSEQFYSSKSKRFLPDRYVEGACPHCGYERARGDQCDKCGKWLEPRELIGPKSKIDGSTPELRETRHWYLPMGRFADEWKKWFDSKEWKDNVRNYSLGWHREGLTDRPITRDLHWGVPVPLTEAEGKVLYVWFDAPIGYISSTKEWAERMGDPERWKRYWRDPETRLVHFIGKDNVVFHAILFPMMLMRAGGYTLPDAIPANEYLTIEGRKISTSQNYAIWLDDYLNAFPPDPLRYAIAANAPETKDTDFSWKQFQSRNNDELADIFGNFLNRTFTFVHRYYEGRVPEAGPMDGLDDGMLAQIKAAPELVGSLLERFEVRNATKAFMDLCRSANKYFNDKAPWETRKTDPVKCATTLHVCIQAAKTLCTVTAPVLPFSSRKLQAMLGMSGPISWDKAAEPFLAAGHPLGEAQILFEKIEDEAIDKEIAKLKLMDTETRPDVPAKPLPAVPSTVPAAPPTAPPASPEKISFDTFKKVELRTAKVMAAERIPKADKLLRLQLDLGGEKRQIVAGVAQSYSPETITGKTILIVANLEPAMIRGVESQGMLLAVKTESGHALITVDQEVSPGIRAE